MSSDEPSDSNPGFYAALDQGIEIRNPRKSKSKEFVEKRPRGRPPKKRRPSETDYLMHRPTQKRERLRADPLVSITTIFEGIIADMKDVIEGVHEFIMPVDKKRVPDYHDIIMKPMCIQSIKERCREHKYSTREEFVEDFELISSNAELYNGPISEITQ